MKTGKRVLALLFVVALVGCSNPTPETPSGPLQQVVCTGLDGYVNASNQHYSWKLDVTSGTYLSTGGFYQFAPRFGDTCAINNIKGTK